MEKKAIIGIIGASFLICISIKYLIECYVWGYVAYYKHWIYPLLDFIPILVIGIALWIFIIMKYWEKAITNV